MRKTYLKGYLSLRGILVPYDIQVFNHDWKAHGYLKRFMRDVHERLSKESLDYYTINN